MKLTKLLTGGCLLLAIPVVAQDSSGTAPKEPPVDAAPLSALPRSPRAAPNACAVLLSELKGLVFVSRPEAVVKAGVSTPGIAFKDVPVPKPDVLEGLISPYLGHVFTRGQLNELIEKVIVYYRHHDRPVVDVFAPEQDITTGTIQVVILEGHVGKITTTGNRWFPNREIREGIRLQPGDPIRSSELQEDLDWLNANPFRNTDAVYRPGAQLGATDIELRTQDRFPLRLYAGYDNDGNAVTGLSRYDVGLNFADPGLGKQVNFEYTTSGEDLHAESGSCIIPLPWRNTLTFFGNHTQTRGAIPPYLGIAGRSDQISGRYSVPLSTIETDLVAYKHTVAAGFDYKYDDNALEFGGLPAGGSLYAVDQFVLSYNGSLSDPHGRTTLDFKGYLSPGHWGGNNTSAAFNAAHSRAASSYTYGTLALERLIRLPAEWSVVVRGTLQLSNSNLAPSEQMGFGGYDTVRGYEERVANADQGTLTTVEIRSPDFCLGRHLHRAEWVDDWQLLAFWDEGTAFNHTLLPNEPRETRLESLGAGLRASVSTYATLRLDWGYRLLAVGSDSRGGSTCDVSFVVSY